MFFEIPELIPESIHLNFIFISIIITFASASHSVITNFMQHITLENYITFFQYGENKNAFGNHTSYTIR